MARKGFPGNGVLIKKWSFRGPDPMQAAESANLDLAYNRRIGWQGVNGMVQNGKSSPYSRSFRGDLGPLQGFAGGVLIAKTKGIVDSRNQAYPVTNGIGAASAVLRLLANTPQRGS